MTSRANDAPHDPVGDVTTDVLVIGTGPAGGAAALACAGSRRTRRPATGPSVNFMETSFRPTDWPTRAPLHFYRGAGVPTTHTSVER